ncbi:MAG: type I glyceraldehyde-3-phosphate dehydrogenase, partial [Polyangiaceae bacterium]|nr:type I glyceraldehyde-3-phosphate dehydrogenase [Polyangiaceae bacterium]
MRVAINGLGRIGRQFLRIACKDPNTDIDVVHINDLADADALAYLVKYDSTHGTWDESITVDGSTMMIGKRRIPVTSERDPSKLPWGKAEVDVVVESTGVFTKRDDLARHLAAGARKVLLSAPGKGLDATFVIGVNDELYDRKKHDVISIGSCTTNGLAPVAKTLHDELGIVHGLMNTVHAYTSTQSLLDQPFKDFRRARAAAVNIVPTSTGAAKAIGEVIPDLAGKLDGLALRVPVPDGSIVDLTCVVSRNTTVKEVNDALGARANGKMKGILRVADVPLVSQDIVGDPHSSIVEAGETRVQGGTLV